MTTPCQCDSCRFRIRNFDPPNRCPNPHYFMECFIKAYKGEKLPEKRCPCYEP